MQKLKESPIGASILILGNGLLLLGVYLISSGLVFCVCLLITPLIFSSSLAQNEFVFSGLELAFPIGMIANFGCFGPLMTLFFASWWYLEEKTPLPEKEKRKNSG